MLPISKNITQLLHLCSELTWNPTNNKSNSATSTINKNKHYGAIAIASALRQWCTGENIMENDYRDCSELYFRSFSLYFDRSLCLFRQFLPFIQTYSPREIKFWLRLVF